MKYCLNYNKDTQYSKYINEADEWNIEYNPKDNTLLSFLDKYKEKRINLHIINNIDFLFLEELCKKYNNLYIMFPLSCYNEILENNYNIKYFFDTRVNNWDLLYTLINTNVTDIYITDELCFELKKISQITKNKNINIRTFLNVAQSSVGGDRIPALKKFFIRPEDVDLYSSYIDVGEFYLVDNKIDYYFEIYKYDKRWMGKLKEIILDFNSELDNKFLIPRFTEKRLDCGKQCFKGGKCDRCDTIEKLANTLEKNNLIINIR